jgi:hypothetical protein
MSDTPPEDPNAAVDAATAIVAAETAKVDPNVDPAQPSGFAHGTLVQAPDSGLWERIVHEFDEVGAFLGTWHKEPVEPPADPDPTPPA